MKEEINVEVVIPFAGKGLFFDFPTEQMDLALEDIKDAITSDFFDIGKLLTKIKLQFRLGDKIEANKYKFYFLNGNFYDDNFFIISVITELELKHYQTLLVDNDKKTMENHNRYDNDLSKFFIADHLGDIIYELVFLTNIARPGSLTIWEGVVLINGIKYGTTRPIFNFLSDAYEKSIKLKYPYFRFYQLNGIRTWLKSNNISFYSKPESKIAVAINCITYIFSYELTNAERLIYSLIGLEALYTKGNNNITEQLNEKIQVYLGSLIDYKRILKDMYSIRSRFLHGDLPIKPFFLFDNTGENDYEDEIYEALLISSSVLIRTIQKMIEEDRKEINFKYVIK